ncbi:MAG: hypothetical protein WBA67_18215 [Jannaschia sp.]
MKSTSFLSTALLALGGCAALVPSTALLAMRLDPLTADPADLATFLMLPDGIALAPGVATLTLSGVRDDDGTKVSETVTLEAWQTGYRIAPVDHARLRKVQETLTDWKAGPGMAGSLSIGFVPCTTGAGPVPDARYSVDILLEAGGRRLPLLRNAPLADIGLDPLAPCVDD